MQRITNYDLSIHEKRVNELLKNVQLRISRRYNYIAIDLFDNKTKTLKETLIAGLTKKQTLEILEALERILTLEKS